MIQPGGLPPGGGLQRRSTVSMGMQPPNMQNNQNPQRLQTSQVNTDDFVAFQRSFTHHHVRSRSATP